MKKLMTMLLAMVLVFSLAACGPKDGDTKPAEGGEKSDLRIALVTDTGGIDDRSFNQGTWEGVQKFSEEFGVETQYMQSNSDADYIPNLSSFSEEEYDLIVAPGFLFADAIGDVATTFPNQKFLIIDSVVENHDNVASAVFAEAEGSYLVGVAAAEAAKAAGKDKVGFIGGADFPLIQGFEAGFEQGVKSVDEGINVVVEYVGGFDDASRAQSIANKMYNEGTYIIFHAAGGAGNGLIKEARDRRTNGEDVWAIGVDKDQYQDGIYEGENSAILTSMIKKVDVASYDVCKMVMEDKFPGGEVLEFNLENDGVGIPEENPNLSDEIVAKVKEAAEKVKSGEITIDVVPNRVK